MVYTRVRTTEKGVATSSVPKLGCRCPRGLNLGSLSPLRGPGGNVRGNLNTTMVLTYYFKQKIVADPDMEDSRVSPPPRVTGIFLDGRQNPLCPSLGKRENRPAGLPSPSLRPSASPPRHPEALPMPWPHPGPCASGVVEMSEAN